MSEKASRGAGSKISSATAASSTSKIPNAPKSAISKSAFAPSHFQLALFASVIQGFDSHHLRIQETTTGRLRRDHPAGSGIRITSLDWGYYGIPYREANKESSKKKRKRDQSKPESSVVAYGTNIAQVCMFSPAEGKVVGNLVGGHDRGIKDFRFSPGDYMDGWSLGEDGKLVQWDLRTNQPTRTVPLSDPNVNILALPSPNPPQLLCASSFPVAIDLTSSDDFRIQSFDSFKHPIHSLFRSGLTEKDRETGEKFLAADSDRYINIYDITKKQIVKSLIVGSEVESLDLSYLTPDNEDASSNQLLIAVTRAGSVELFSNPFGKSTTINGDIKAKRKSMTRKADAQVKFIRPNSTDKSLPVFAASLQGPELLVALVNGGIDVSFEKIRWQDEATGELLFDGIKEVVSRQALSTLNTATMNGVKDISKSHVDESKTVVIDGGVPEGSQAAAIEILSSDDDVDAANATDEDEDSEVDEKASRKVRKTQESEPEIDATSDADKEEVTEMTIADQDKEMNDYDAEKEVDDEEPTFGELVAPKQLGMITIADNDQLDQSTPRVAGNSRSLVIPTGMSLATVLTQSLRTNDKNLLETCLHSTDVDIVKATIKRLDSSLAGILLQKLADRLSSRPGRYGHLLTWVQWICVAHGGSIASRPDVASKIRSLYKVLTQRAQSLDNLLLLKGKLDMLDAQLSYRKELRAARGAQQSLSDGPAVIYVEGQDNWSSDEDEEMEQATVSQITKKGKQPRKPLDDLIADSESEDAEGMPAVNGISHSDSDGEEDGSEEEETDDLHPRGNGLIDDEADESDEEEEEEEEDSDSENDDDSSQEDEEDSEIDSFINDDSISEVDDENDDDEVVEENITTPEKPPAKRVKRV